MPTVKKDLTLAGAVELARAAAQEIAEPGAVGDYLGVVMDEDRLATHSFRCESRAYRGWRWAVTVARAPRSRAVTVSETHLLPGDDAVVAPEWLPYAKRLEPSDIGPGDVLPRVSDDPNLEAGYTSDGDEAADEVARELRLERPRVMTIAGRDAAAQRWHDGDGGPESPAAEKSAEPCARCGFFVPLSGTLRSVFGVCANGWSPFDGRVVSLDHGCGAHSETDVPAGVDVVLDPVLDDLAFDVVAR